MRGGRRVIRGASIILGIVLATQALVLAAWAAGDEFFDANDVTGKLDIRRAWIDVSGSPKVAVFSITTYGRWRANYLLDEFDLRNLGADFDSRGGKSVDYYVIIDAANRNEIVCDLYRRRGRKLLESEQATKGPRIVACSFGWKTIRPAGRVRWRVDSLNYSQWDRAPDDGAFRKI